MALNRFAHAIDIQQFFIAKILHTTNGGWICSIGDSEVFLPGSQLYKDIEDYEAYVGNSVKVMVQRADRWSTVVSHKDYVKKISERKNIISNLQRGQKLSGIIKGITENGYQINVMGIIGFMHKDEMCDPDNYDINCPIEFAVQKADPESSILLLSQKLYNQICHKELEQKKREELKKTYDSIEIGNVIICTVNQILKTGVSVDIGGVFGYLSYNEIPSNLTLAVNDTVEIVVISKDDEKRRVAVSIKVLNEYKQLQAQNEFVSTLKPYSSRLYAKVYRIDKDSVRVNISNFKGIILREDISLNYIQRLDDEVFVNQELEVQFKEYRDGNIYCSLLFAEQERYPDTYYELDDDDLLQTIGIGNEPIIGQVVKSLSGSTNVVAMCQKSTGRILNDPISGVNMVASVPFKYVNLLMEGEFYEFNLKAWSQVRRKSKHNPYIFDAIPSSAYPQAQNNPYKICVDRKFRLRNNPLSNRDDARILDEIGADMYLNRGRMFYELLQNADDAAAKLGVRIRIQVVGDYLLFVHDGKSFDLKDFDAITSMANSHKSDDNSKTGYKGIGFKSVFTDSLQVFIKTGGFFFSFDKTSGLFDDFEGFYDKVNNFLSDQQRALFYSDFSEYKEDFDKVNHIPWQLLPFWNNDIPEGLRKTLFEMRSNVAIALALKPGLAEEYQKLIKGILQDPRFMLFLRRTRRIQFVDNGKTMTIAKNSRDGIVKLQNSFDENERNTSYIATIEEEIESSNENYTKCGIAMHKQCDTIGGKKKWSMYQDWSNNSTPVTNIPERVIEANTTGLSYAILLNEEGKVVPLPCNTPSLYAYLPMEDREHLLPFYVNADFMLKSQREGAKPTNPWNHFIFYNIGLKIPEWVSKVARIDQPNYLSILPTEYFKEDLEDEKKDELAVHFNRGYREALSTTPFILNDKNEIVCQSNIVIDESGVANIIGANAFCELFGLTKRLVNNAINIEPLRNTAIFREIEHVQTSELIDKILAPNNRVRLLRFWCSLSVGTRALVLAHIANIPGNKKNLNDYIEEIPAYTCRGRLMSFKKLLKSDKVILRSDVIFGIEDIVEKLGIRITDEDETRHPFHDKIEKAMIGYSIHVFNIIKSLSSKKDCPLSASEKYRLFSHFTTSKRNIEHDSLTDWSIFCNQQGNNVQLCQLTHIDSLLYNNITGQFVISEVEYSKGSRVIDRYLMKEKDQYEGIILGKWDTLVAEVGESEEKACSLYKLASTTYKVAEHEQVKEMQAFPVTEKRFVFSKGQMHLLSEVILNEKLSNNDDATRIIELLTRKSVPSVEVSKSVKQVPFECKSQRLEDLTILSDVVLSQEQVIVLLQYCSSNDETLFTNYAIDEIEGNNTFTALPKGSVVAYTSNKVLKDFVNEKCNSIYLLPDIFAKYSNLRGIVTDDDLLIRILEVIGDVKEHEQVLLPVYKDSISKVKTLYISHLSEINLNENSCKEKSDINIQTLLLASSIEKPEAELFDTLRDIIHITCGVTTTALSSIKLDHTVEVNGKSFPLSKLLPNEDNMANLVDTLKERIEEFVPVLSFTNSLFGSEVDEGRADSVFEVLNKANVVLENGIQIAFVLEYAAYNKKYSIVCNVLDSERNPVSKALCGKWMLQYYSFANPTSILNDKYGDLVKYLALPYSNNIIQCSIVKELSNFNCLKEKLSEEETFDLLDLVYKKSSANMVISPDDVGCFKRSLGLTGAHYIVSDYYSLQDEKLPEVIEKWRIAKDSDVRTAVLCNVFCIINEDSNVVHIRKFLRDGTPFTITDKDNITSALTCNWLSGKELLINDNQYLLLQGVINDDSYICEKDEAALSKYVSPENPYMTFSDYHIYLYDGEIPWHVKLKANNYIFHHYNEGDIALSGLNIFINSKQTDNIINLIRSLVNTGDFSTDDFFQFFEQYQSRLSGSFEGEIDDDLNSEARSAASEMAKQEAVNWLTAKGYDTSNVQTEYSFVNGVKKDGVEYHIVVKSFRTKKNVLNVNPNEWLYLLKANSRLMVYLGHMTFAVFDRKLLLGNHDFLKLRISTSNFEVENGRLDDVISRLAKDIQYFERTHFVFEHIHEDILSGANSLDDYNFYSTNSEEQFTAANDSDIL